MDTRARRIIWFIVGTRPEMIKLAPVIMEAEKRAIVSVIATGQHPAVEDIADGFRICIQVNLGIQNISLDNIVRSTLSGLESEAFFQEGKPDCIVVQGDTTSAMAAALWGFNNKVPVAHVEAGLRTWDLDSPYPEEGNRRMISSIATYHYPPTASAYNTLLAERAGREDNLLMAGNTVIDALKTVPEDGWEYEHPTALMTLHRRESWGDPMIQTLEGVLDWLEYTDMQVVWPVHPGTTVQGIAASFNHPRLVKEDPMDYWDFVQAMRSAQFLITDSGGVQEEATALGKYTLVVRHETERFEAILAGIAHLVCPERTIVREALGDAEAGWSKVKPSTVFGDGHAAKHIMAHLMDKLDC